MSREAVPGKRESAARQIASLLIVCLMLSIGPSTATSANDNPRELNQESIAAALHRLGARLIRPNEYELEKGVILRLGFNRGSLTGASVSVTRQYEEPRAVHLSEDDDSERACCMSRVTFDRFLRLIDGLKTIGNYDEPAVFGVVSPAGWVTWLDYYKRAVVSRFARTCPESDQTNDCGISSFHVSYYSSIFRGSVRSEHVEKRQIEPFGDLSTYFLVVGDTKVEVSGEDFERVREGNKIEVGVISTKGLVKVLGLKGQPR